MPSDLLTADPFAAAQMTAARTQERENARALKLQKFRRATIQRLRREEAKKERPPGIEAWVPLPRQDLPSPEKTPFGSVFSPRSVLSTSPDRRQHVTKDTFSRIPILESTHAHIAIATLIAAAH